ncbi:MAG: ATP-binding protein [Verrucomicrobia bacterium]|nr:ATP-binding protein [Verrucomicrobiota bacterium]
MRPRLENGVVREIVAACVEVTALKDAERELRTAKERAEAADRAKSDFLAVMTHEIRTPLNAVLGFSEVLRDSPLSPEQRKWLAAVSAGGESLLALIEDILDYSRIESGRLQLQAEPVALASLLSAVVAQASPRAAAKNLPIVTECAPDVPDYILTDSTRLRQILRNLVGNAVKFTTQGSVRVAVALASPPARPGESCLLRFTVTDTGIGIAADRRDRLFKAFSQVDSSSTRQYGGTGLGLAICQRLTHLLGGEIGVETERGVGSAFTFTIRTTVVASPPARGSG